MSTTEFQLDAFSIVGTGAVGTALTRALLSVGCRLDHIVSRRRASAESFRREIGGDGTVVSARDSALSESELLILAVPDDALPALADDLASSDADWSGTVVLHTSGALDSRLLLPVALLGADTGSFHPIQTFGPGAGPDVFEGITVGIEGMPGALSAAHALADALLCQAVELDPDHKTLYHAAAVVAGNYITTLLGVAQEMWDSAVDSEISFTAALAPLARQSLDNALEFGPDEALTGPVARGDVGTIERQMDALGRVAEHLLPLYGVLAVESVHLAVRSGRLSTDEAVPVLDAIHARIDRTVRTDGGMDPV